MIDAARLRDELQELVVRLEDDLREQLAQDTVTDQRLRADHAAAHSARRTAQAYEPWRDAELTQAAVAYVLGCVFVRFLEDNDLIASPWLAGPVGPRLDKALDRRTAWFQQHPRETDLGYLRAAFSDVARLPAMGPLFDERHNACWSVALSPDGATLLYKFWQRRDDAGALVHDFADTAHSTRFLGDLYQDLSAAVRDRYALFQTPEFVEEFILDRTLEPAITEFGLNEVTLLDPTCGSGHFLLGAFARLLRGWQLAEPGTKTEVLVQRALDAVAGADLNPYAIAIARFRLLVSALHQTGIRRLTDARNYKFHLAVADSLLHGNTWGARRQSQMQLGGDALDHVYRTEDRTAIDDVLGRRYRVVVGNPPYVTVKDTTVNAEYRRYGSCYRQFSLAVPFTERFFDLAQPSADVAGYVGMITANSFMKREFGKPLIETYLPRWDLTHVLDTSGAFIPNHGTPTVILIARHRPPVAGTVRMVMGIRGEPETPSTPAEGQVWTEILRLVDRPGESGDFVSTTDLPREHLGSHPWSIGGGGAAELKSALDDAAPSVLKDVIDDLGTSALTREDEVYYIGARCSIRRKIPEAFVLPFVLGEDVRDWSLNDYSHAIWPYHRDTLSAVEDSSITRFLWPWRRQLSDRVAFGLTQLQRGLCWYEYSMFFPKRFRSSLSIAFAFVATHNHFVLDRGGKVFKQSAPVIKLPATATEDDHLGLLALLNSSTACFWMKQVFYPKATAAGDISLEKGRPEANRYEFAGTGLLSFPIPKGTSDRLVQISRKLDAAAARLDAVAPSAIIALWSRENAGDLAALLSAGAQESRSIRRRMIVLQEEADWEVYRLFGLSKEGADGTVVAGEFEADPGDRPYAWDTGTRNNLKVPLRTIYERRKQLTAESASLSLIETPVYKRLWLGPQGVFGHSTRTYEERADDGLRDWLLTRMEDRRYWFGADGRPVIVSCARLADRLRDDRDFLQVAALYRRREDFDLTALVVELADSDAVPFLAAHRYSSAGRRKRVVWERTWELQRQEDAIDARQSGEAAKVEKARVVSEIPVPPKYGSGDFAKQTYWRLRGKLDVPKERFILYPGAERDVDTTPVIGWAGWDHLEQARALAEFTVTMRETEAWPKERIAPLLAGLDELVPWLKQWHNDRDPSTGERLGDYFAGFVAEETRSIGMTLEELRSFEPAKPTRGRRPRKSPAKPESTE